MIEWLDDTQVLEGFILRNNALKTKNDGILESYYEWKRKIARSDTTLHVDAAMKFTRDQITAKFKAFANSLPLEIMRLAQTALFRTVHAF